METITLTFGDVAENHVGMQKIGRPLADNSFLRNLTQFRKYYREQGFKCELYDLKCEDSDCEEAQLLVVRNYWKEDIFSDLEELDWDKKVKMYGEVRNKRARYNLCFADFEQEPEYEEGKGRVYDFSELPFLQKLRESLEENLENVSTQSISLVAEGNYYYNSKCYIGYHGDTERNLVFGVRFGSPMKLLYQWYRLSKPVSDEAEILLQSGDLYIMSSKAIGNDWKTRKIPTLRHSAKF